MGGASVVSNERVLYRYVALVGGGGAEGKEFPKEHSRWFQLHSK